MCFMSFFISYLYIHLLIRFFSFFVVVFMEERMAMYPEGGARGFPFSAHERRPRNPKVIPGVNGMGGGGEGGAEGRGGELEGRRRGRRGGRRRKNVEKK